MAGRIIENVLFFFVLMFFVAAPCSVAYSEVAIGVVVALRLLRAAMRGEGTASLTRSPTARAVALPMLAWVIASIVSALFAEYRAESLLKLPKLLLLGLVFLLPAILVNEKRLRHAVGALLVGATITSAYGIGYYLNDPSTRLGGFVGNYMSMAGMLMMIVLVAFAILYVGRAGGVLRWIAAGSIPVILGALYLTNTRSSWLALLVGLAAMVPFTRKRYILVPVLLVALLLVVPGQSRSTAVSAVDLGHSRNQERLFMWKAGIEMFRDHPAFGVGMAGIREIYGRYQDPRSVEKAVHLHNVPIQVLAAMGITGFAAWLYLFGALPVALVRARGIVGEGAPVLRATVIGAIAACAGFITNGVAEWNLGDVEVITIFWSIVGLAAAATAIAPRRGEG